MRTFLKIALAGVALGALSLPALAQTAGKPELGSFGVDLSGRDLSVKPGDDFNLYANGVWMKNTKIPDDRASYGAFVALREKSEKNVRAIIEELAAKPDAQTGDARKVGTFYAAFMDEARIEQLGMTPLAADFAEVEAVKTQADLVALLGRWERQGLPTPFGFFINQDEKKPDQYAVYLGQGGIGLPDRDYYLEDKFKDAREKYKAYIATVLTQAGFDKPQERSQAIFALEDKIARVHWSRVESRDADKTYNPWPTAEFATRAPGVDWVRYFTNAGIEKQPQLIVAQPSAITGMAKIFAETPVATWQDWLRFQLVRAAAPVLPKETVQANFDFYGKELTGAPQLRDRWKRGVQLTEGALGEAIGAVYVQRHFPPEAKAQMDQLVANVIEAYRTRIAELTWMGPETKKRALLKLSTFRPKIGYPVKWRDYSGLEIAPGDAYGNWKRANAFEVAYYLNKLGKPVDRDEWFMTPQTVNAYYNPPMNEIVFPAAILQPPFFDPNADPAVNYGGIGAVIGHEIGHGFDDQGSKYDETGRLANWWTDQDRTEFKKRTDALSAQYSSFEPLPGLHVNGDLTLGENIGDLGGMENAYTAYKASLGGKPAPVIDGLNGDQRFFLGWAQVWRSLIRDPALKQQLTVDPHSPGSVRAKGPMRNLDAWYAAFGVQSGDKAYVAPEQRVRIW
ncbi:MAG: M13 family peptidase [Sphingomonadales bacterium]|nr:MAG: M13 family peptidase [Sphingomonadales bacterium]